MNNQEAALTQNSEHEYTLNPGQDSCWVTVDNLSVHIIRTDEGVVVDIFGKGKEDEDYLASTYAFNFEAEGEE